MVKNSAPQKEKKSKKENYELKSDAVDALAKADNGEAPVYSKQELDKYRSRSKIHISDTCKVLLLKVWFAGAVCFFFIWGLGVYISSTLDLLFVTAIALGMVTDLLANNALRFIEKNPGENNRWMMFPKKSVGSFFCNILYGCLIVYCVYMLYTVINYVYCRITGQTDVVLLAVGPIFFGIFCMGFDVLFLGVKRMLLDFLAGFGIGKGSGTSGEK